MARSQKTPTRRPVRTRKVIKRRSVSIRQSRSILPWPIIVFVMLCVGVLLVGWTFQAVADNLHVTAQVHAPIPSGPAIITSPADGTHFSNVPITVKGSCPLDTYVKLYDNNLFRGTAICTAGGTFQLQIDLFPGANQLTAQDFNITDDPGPAGNKITVYYDVPVQPVNSNLPGAPNPPSTIPSSTPPFELQTDYSYKGYEVGQVIDWTFNASGGNPPYAINMDWGDGTNTVISQKDIGKFVASHRYKAAGSGPKSSYIIKVSGSDSYGRRSSLQLFVIVRPSGLPNVVASSLPSGPRINNNWLLLAWPAYLVLLLMFTSFWLGEREELITLKRSGVLRRRGV